MSGFAWTKETTADFKEDLDALNKETVAEAQQIVQIGREIIASLQKYPYPDFLGLVDDCAALLVTRSRAIAEREAKGRQIYNIPGVRSELRRIQILLRELLYEQEKKESLERVADLPED